MSIRSMIGWVSVFVLACGLSQAVAQGIDTNKVVKFNTLDMESLDNLQKLQKGYIINYQVIEDRDDPVKLTVSDSGELIVPYYTGLIKAAGKTCKEVAFDVKNVLEQTHYKRATVLVGISSIAYTNTGHITVMGSVKEPGIYPVLPGESYTVTMAIAKAGGPTDFANLKKVQLTRIMEDGERRPFEVNVKAVIEKGKLDEDMDVKASDYIFVPQSFWR